MALTITAGDVAVVEVFEKVTVPTAEAVSAGQMVRLETSTGKATLSNATTAAEARALGISLTTVTVAGLPITAVKRGIVDVGNALADLNWDQAVYLDNTDGALGTAAGSTSVVVGRVVPGWGYTTADKLLFVDLEL